MTISLIVMGIAIIGAGATFGYEKLLESTRDKKAQELAAAEASISRATIEEFLRLQNRLTATETLLDEHVALSYFFNRLEELTLSTVAFESLNLTVEEDRTTTFLMDGTARSFNALAAQSAAFAAEKRIKRAIFSDISVGDKGLVTFSLKAELDPALIKWAGAVSAPVEATVPAATSTQP